MRNIFPVFFTLISLVTYSQQTDWQHKDPQKDSLFGMSVERVYNGLLKNKKSQTVIVAIIDSGLDTAHADLKKVLWRDKKTELNGWNYIGAETGREDVTMLVANRKDFYDSLSYTFVPEQYRKGYQAYRKVAPALEGKISAMKNFIQQLQQYDTGDAKELTKLANHHLEHGLNINNAEADTAKGDADVTPDKIGPLPNPNLAPWHGTHVAGIVGAVRNNNEGMDGVADNVQLMTLKVNGNIRELRDKSLADAIRFAVDHGAKVINISMGKPYTWNKKAVDEAVNYAMKKDVMIIHAAGNTGENIDIADNFPNKRYADSTGQANGWIEVGASDKKGNAADFSNYGKVNVDVFAPGVDIYSTIPGNKYESWSGTSMAAPMVAGLAALIRGYNPKLTAVQVKDIIMQSVVKRDALKDKCVSGGIVNAYNALKLAATYK